MRLFPHLAPVSGLSLVLALAIIPQAGADERPSQPADGNGVYVGGFAGYSRGSVRPVIVDAGITAVPGTYGNLTGGLIAGYSRMIGSRWMAGVEADVAFPNYLDSDAIAHGQTVGASRYVERMNAVGTLRGRIGYVVGDWTLFGTGGLAWSIGRVSRAPLGAGTAEEHERRRLGWAAGAGIERAMGGGWAARAEYLYTDLGAIDAAFAGGARYRATLGAHYVRLGLTYRPGAAGPEGIPNALPDLPRVEVKGQTTLIYQGYPSFSAAYTGPNSFLPTSQIRQTWTGSLFIGVRLWECAELHYSPELAQGFGLAGTFGAGGHPNGEAQKSSFLYPRYNTSRLYLRQTFGLGGPREELSSEWGQMSGSRDISRVTVQVGKFSVKDMFDNNAYAQDSRTDFLNWSIWAGGAFDYPADLVGLTYGAAAELNQPNFALRSGYFLIGSTPNSNHFDRAVFRRGGYVGEVELRFQMFGQTTKLRLTGFVNHYLAGSYREALGLVASNPGLDPTDAITQTRRSRVKYGYVVNLEQPITEDLGVFARWSWNNGRTEIAAFTDIDASFSGGLQLKGTVWNRPQDRIGLGFAINQLSRDHRDYLAAGGLGILVGDGQLTYRAERVFEAFYAAALPYNTTLTLNYQLLVNPAYNADRGPLVSVLSSRLRVTF